MSAEVMSDPISKSNQTQANGIIHHELLSSKPINPRFLVSFLVDARGGTMYGGRHSGVDIIIPPSKVCMPTRLTCRLLKKEKILAPPLLNEEDAFASRFLQLGPVGTKFIGPVLIELPHFASRLNKERELVILKSNDGKTWNEHKSDTPGDSFEKFIGQSEKDVFSDKKYTAKIYTTEFPKYFVAVSKLKQVSKQLDKSGGALQCSTAHINLPAGSVNKETKITLEVIPVTKEHVSHVLNHNVETSYIVSIEPRRRKFHQPISVGVSVTKELQEKIRNHKKGSTHMPVLLLYSITGGSGPAIWEDITNSVLYSINKDIVSFNTAVSARYWLLENNLSSLDFIKDATKIYEEAVAVPFYACFYVLAKRHSETEFEVRVLCMNDGDVKQTLEHEEHFIHLGTSDYIEVLQGKPYYLEMSGNLMPSIASANQLFLIFRPFRVNRLSYIAKVQNPDEFLSCQMFVNRDSTYVPAESHNQPPSLCSLDITFPNLAAVSPLQTSAEAEEKWREVFQKVQQDFETNAAIPNNSKGPELKLLDIADHLKNDWVALAGQLGITSKEVVKLQTEYGNIHEQAILMLHLWVDKSRNNARANDLEAALKRIGREDIIDSCIRTKDAKSVQHEDPVHPIDESYHECTWSPDNTQDSDALEAEDKFNGEQQQKPPKPLRIKNVVPTSIEEPAQIEAETAKLQPQPKIQEFEEVEKILEDGSVLKETIVKETLQGHVDAIVGNKSCIPALEITEVLNENDQDDNIVKTDEFVKTSIIQEIDEVLEDGTHIKITKIKEVHTSKCEDAGEDDTNNVANVIKTAAIVKETVGSCVDGKDIS